MIAVDLSFTGAEPRFDAVDKTGVYAITKQYAAKCGYSVGVHPLLGLVELRASYFSCHTDNKDDEVFTFNFNLNAHHEQKNATYALKKTCSPSVPWSPREVTCEVNYMEVSVRSKITCPSRTKTETDDWSALKPVLAHSSTTSDWQVMFQRAGAQMPPITMSQARKKGYVFDLTDGRLVFRTPYGQPESSSTEMNGVPVEVVHATVFSRQRWLVLMVDLVAACSTHKGSRDNSGYVMWKTPELLYPSLDSTRIRVGLNGELEERPVAEAKGYVVEKDNSTIHISVPYNADGGHRKSFVTGGLYEFYMFHLYLEQIFVDDDRAETMLRIHRILVSPLLPCLLFTDNQTVLEERVFTVYLGNIPEDIVLTSVHLNGQEFPVPFPNASSYTIMQAVQPNNTRGYTLKVPFDDPVVTQQVSRKDATIQYRLDINYTMIVEFLREPYYHLASIVALSPYVSHPAFDAVCSESGINFKLDHQPFDYLWDISIGSDVLTSKLAAQHGYILTNDSQSLVLNVPLFAHGYQYENVTLKGFFATFEILMRNRDSSEVQTAVKTCPFNSELIMCSSDGRMTVVADLSLAIPSGGSAARTNLIDNKCGPKEVDGTRALFSFPLNSCGSTIKLGVENVTYQNEIFYNKSVSGDATGIMLVQCTYPLASLRHLFLMFKFESDTAGVGSIIRPAAKISSPVLQSSTIKPTTTLQTTPSTRSPTRNPVQFRPAVYPPAVYKPAVYQPPIYRPAVYKPAIYQPAVHPTARYIKTPTKTVLPSISNRTLRHPSFLPLYAAAGFTHQRQSDIHTIHPLIPAEIFYTDPGLPRGRRIPNLPSGLRVFDCSRLNTPPPIMSACPVPPNRPDPFRSGPHPTRDLGSSTWRIHSTDSLPRRVVIQLTQEEDQAITNLLKLHYQESPQREEAAAQMNFCDVVEPPVNSNTGLPPHKPVYVDVQSPREAGCT
ncbi:zona pellucida protein AX 4 [Stegastes partitus]|uniref:Zona pellucida protein AX 4 n=1 Tax=Stegastes partitus TaxID=144197 RepID=A0A9Y4N158_9TELE|nr:PREDICTED: histone deacetylase complex subunit SAP25 [Stegastes partitus]